MVALLSLISFKDSDVLPSFNIPHMDKIVHMGFYFGIAVLGMLSIREWTQGMLSFGKTMLWAMGFALMYGIVIEVLQSVCTIDREGDMLDVLANGLGAILGGAAMKYTFLGKGPFRWGR